MKLKNSGLTLVELLTVVGIMALLVGLLIPALSTVHRIARETKQKAHLVAVELALTTFKNDYGEYPPSDWTPVPMKGDYCGAQKLAEALLGRDLLGFHPRSNWSATDLTWYPNPTTMDSALFEANLKQRKELYLELSNANAFRLGNISLLKPGLYPDTSPLAPDTFVLCDVFGARNVLLTNGKIVKAGAPILYFKANSSEKTIQAIYNINDNDAIVALKEQMDVRGHPFGSGPFYPPYKNRLEFFYGNPDPATGIIGYIQNPKVAARPWPYKSDSFILISAGADGIYGTPDDIRNFAD